MKTKKSAKSAPAKARRLEEIAESKKGLFAIDPTLLSIEPGFNERINYGDIDQLADDIAANGLETPFKIRKVEGSETIFIVHGHRRHRAITEKLIPSGRWHNPDGSLKTVDCYAEARGTTDFDRLAGQLSSNTGLAYNLLEKAGGYKRLMEMEPAIKAADLARRFGETKQAVSDALRLANDGCKELHAAILKGTMAASTAIHIIKQVGANRDAQKALLQTALENSNSGHITPKHIPAPETETETDRESPDSPAPEPAKEPANSSTDHCSLITDHSIFQLYSIDNVPEEPIQDGSPFYHETDRFVLTSPETFGYERLHLLCAATVHGTAYGYRINDREHLPDVSHLESLGTAPEEGFKVMLKAAIATDGLVKDGDISELLYDALCRYFPETGEAEEAERLSFACASESPAPEKPATGYQAILNAKPTGGSGGNGGGGTGYASPDKQLEKIEKVLEDLAEKNLGLEDRVTTADILLGVLRNERPAGDLKNYLLGK